MEYNWNLSRIGLLAVQISKKRTSRPKGFGTSIGRPFGVGLLAIAGLGKLVLWIRLLNTTMQMEADGDG